MIAPVIEIMTLAEVMAALKRGRSRVFELLAAGVLERAPRVIYRASVYRALLGPELGKPKPRRPPVGC